MISSPPLPTVQADVIPRADGGAKVIPYVLPLDVAKESMTMTVRDWLRLNRESNDG